MSYKLIFSEDCIRTTEFEPDQDFINSLKNEWQEYVHTIEPYPGHFKGKGIVICAGLVTYMTCAWVNISILRKHGCILPIEVWYSGNELTEEVISAFETLGVKCKNCQDYTTLDIENFAMKPFAILHSSFKEILFLDADNNCLTDPSYLFDHEHYQSTGAIFWPDFWTTDKNNPIWKVVASEDFDSIEQESGQILINKEKCWKEINLCMYFNINKEHYYSMLLGDKDTFKFAWIALRSPYYMIPTHVGGCGFSEPDTGFHGLTMVQHDFNGNILFLHRNWMKWDITKDDETLWIEIKRFKPNAKKLFFEKHFSRDNYRHPFWDIKGDVESIPFRDLFGDFELTCLEILKDLRNRPFYGRFLLYAYFYYFRPGYSEGYMDNFHATDNLSTAPAEKVNI